MTNIDQLNKFAEEQQVLGESIDNIVIQLQNAKTRAQYTTLRNKLEAEWQEFRDRHNNYKARGGLERLPTHSYIQDRYFETVEKIYNDAIATNPFESNITVAKKATNTASSNVTETAIDTKIRRLQALIDELLRYINQVEMQSLIDSPKEIIEFHKNEISALYDPILKLNAELAGQIDPSPVDNIRARVLTFTAKISENSNKQNMLFAPDRPNLALPKVVMPFFEGNFEKWIEFSEMFTKVIHENQALSDIEKFQYLKQYLKGEPAKLIQNLPFSTANYKEAWATLTDRYHNQRLLVYQLVDAILDQPTCRKENARDLRNLHDTTKEKLKAIANLKINSFDAFISRLITRKWDHDTNKLYEQSIREPNTIQSLDSIYSFLEKRFLSLESMQNQQSNRDKQQYIPQFSNQQHPATSYSNQIQYRCPICSDNHILFKCGNFRALSPSERLRQVHNKKLCVNCLQNHSSIDCRHRGRCQICDGPHNTLLHAEDRSNPQKQDQPKYNNNFKKNKTAFKNSYISTNEHSTSDQVILATALVKIPTASGIPCLARVLLDQGSQASFITETCAQTIGLPRNRVRAIINGVGDNNSQVSKWTINTELKPIFPSNFSLNVCLYVLPKVSGSVPNAHLPENLLECWDNKLIADPTFNRPGPIDVLLGAHHISQLIKDGLIKNGSLIGQNTEFGWAISGSINETVSRPINVSCMITNFEEKLQLQKFWEFEEIPQPKLLSAEDAACEEWFRKTTTRNSDGSYTVRLPLKEEKITLGNSKSRAAARFIQLEKKFKRQPEYQERYHEFIREYMQLGHMSQSITDDAEGYFIPHHAVIREESLTTKLRVVFDASCKTDRKVSLNDKMYIGPQLQTDLSEILLRWRKHKIVFSADIEKMFRQIHIHEEDQKFQKILWRWSPGSPLQTYQLTTVTYGTAAAPYLAIRTLHQLCDDEQHHFPQASAIVKNDTYVDDILSGADTTEKALVLQQQLITLLKAGKFNLRKWSSNDPQLLNFLAPELRQQSSLEFNQTEAVKYLGVFWNPQTDSFFFRLQPISNLKFTKRSILSEISKIFDPLGWLAPVTIKVKLLIQELWIEGKEWDQAVSPRHQKQWALFNEEINQINQLQIPRWLGTTQSIELHGFSDASEKAYGAVVYSRIVKDGQVKINLLQAKSKVAPKKTKTTLPRLELCAAVLLAKLITKIQSALQIETTRVYAWSDSTITLAWIRADPTKWETFVSNRVAVIQQLVAPECWNHVLSGDNPADVISRGIDPNQLQQHVLWWQGPTWLKKTPSQWPTQITTPTIPTEELKCNVAITAFAAPDNNLINRFSNFARMLRVLAYCRRFKTKIQGRTVSFEEMNNTLNGLIRTHTRFTSTPPAKINFNHQGSKMNQFFNRTTHSETSIPWPKTYRIPRMKQFGNKLISSIILL